MLIGIVCGFIDSSLGMGYGVASTSILVSFGITPALASASIHTAEGIVDVISSASHFKMGNVETKRFWKLGIPGIFGAILGAVFISRISLSASKPFVALVLFIMGLIILFRFARKKILIEKKLPESAVPLLGFVAAFIDVSGGGGWGPLCTPVFILGGSEPRKAVGTVEATEPIISFTAMIAFGVLLGFESFLWGIVLPIVIGGLILTPFGAYVIRKKIPVKVLGILVGLLLVILNIRTLISWVL